VAQETMRATLTIVGLLCSFGLVDASAGATQKPIDPKAGCRRHPEVVDKCRTLHGRLFVSNGTPGVRIWPVGTRRILGVLPSEDEIVPEVLKRHLYFDTSIYGDFEVCPFTREKPDEMQFVCVESAADLVVERFVEGKDAPIIFRISS